MVFFSSVSICGCTVKMCVACGLEGLVFDHCGGFCMCCLLVCSAVGVCCEALHKKWNVCLTHRRVCCGFFILHVLDMHLVGSVSHDDLCCVP